MDDTKSPIFVFYYPSCLFSLFYFLLFYFPKVYFISFISPVERAKAVVTDSGGITLRDNTERPETCTMGTNELIGTDPAAVKPALDLLFGGQWKKGAIPALWDGHTAERIVEILLGVMKDE